jgi:hypothetical protein
MALTAGVKVLPRDREVVMWLLAYAATSRRA